MLAFENAKEGSNNKIQNSFLAENLVLAANFSTKKCVEKRVSAPTIIKCTAIFP
jgi:hypothetical protein